MVSSVVGCAYCGLDCVGGLCGFDFHWLNALWLRFPLAVYLWFWLSLVVYFVGMMTGSSFSLFGGERESIVVFMECLTQGFDCFLLHSGCSFGWTVLGFVLFKIVAETNFAVTRTRDMLGPI